MADVPTPRSPEQILGDIIDAFRSKQGVKNLRVGGPLLSLFEAAMRSDARGAKDVFDLLNAIALDHATELALDRIGNDEKVPRIQESPATGTTDVADSSFEKKSTKLFQGSPAPIAGSTSVDVSDASLFPNSGQIYIGRGTPNYEGPLTYTSRTNNGTHWTLALSTGTTKFHNTSESVILAQGGNRVVGAGTIVRTPQANVSDAIEFRTLYTYTLPDGETSISGIQVVAQKPGKIGNVIKGAIKEFSSQPFSGATVTNPSPYSNGQETEKDDDYRERIKNVRASRQAGTSLAITTAVTGTTATDENKRVSSASLVKRLGFASTLYIDDGTGYEERTAGVAIETLVDSAIGGEQDFETGHRPIARAFVETSNTSPYQLAAGSSLTVKVGGVTYTHSFDTSAFTSIGNATAHEVAASINSNPNLGFLARTADAGTKVVLFGNSDTNEDIEVVAATVGTDGNAALAFPLGINFTLQLYKNDRLLTKDGRAAALTGLPSSQWDTFSGSQTLTVSVDSTPALTFTFTNQDFIDAQTSFVTVGKNSVAAWVAVINAKIPGVTATEDAGRIVLTSNAGPVAKAGVAITGGSLVTHHLFAVVSVVGANRDYALDRNSSKIHLEKILVAGDKLTIGSTSTRAFVESTDISPTTLGSTAKMWFVVDGDADVIDTGVNTALKLNITPTTIHDWGHYLILAAASGTPFANVRDGDWVIMWDPALHSSVRGAFRVVDPSPSAITVERRELATFRMGHRSVALQTSGATICSVLNTGGTMAPLPAFTAVIPVRVTDSCETYNPNTKVSTPVTPMSTPRVYHTATLLNSGKVLVAGGFNDAGAALKSIETYDPTNNTWTTSAVTLDTAVGHHTATLLSNGKVLFAGGDSGTGAIQKYQVYNPTNDTITIAQNLVNARAKHKAVLMPNNNVLIVGGYDASYSDLQTTEIWDSVTTFTAAAASMARARSGFGLSLVGNVPTTVIAAGNRRGAAGNTTREVYTIGTDTWGAETALPGNISFEEKDLVRITNGKVVGAHGYDTTSPGTGKGFVWDGAVMTTFFNSVITDWGPKWAGQYVELKNGNATYQNVVANTGGAVQGNATWGFVPTATVEVYDAIGNSWSFPDPADASNVAITDSGMAFVRTDGVVREVDIPAGSNYTANTLAAVLNADAANPGLVGVTLLGAGLTGATATIYKTKKVRVATNTFSTDGDIALVAQDDLAAGFGLSSGDSISNLTGHIGSVRSNSELGTPSFQDVQVLGNSKGTIEKIILSVARAGLGDCLVGLRDWWRGADTPSTFSVYPDPFFYRRGGTNFGLRTRLLGSQEYTDVVRADVRSSGIEPWSPLDRAYLASPFALSSNDDLTVQVDNDVAKRYAVKMYRALNPVGNTYAQTNTFKDGDGGGASLAVTFGLNFNFNDFAVHMAARAAGYIADASRNVLFRYYRLGPDGEGARIRVGNPRSSNQPVSVTIDPNDSTDMTVRIQSGVDRTLPNIRVATSSIMATQTAVSAGSVGTYIYVANMKIATASRTANVVSATLTLPPGVTNHGLQIGDKIWVQSTDVNFSSGIKTITARTNSTLQYAETAANVGATANIGTVSRDTLGEVSFAGGGVIVGDFYITDVVAGVNKTMRISTVDGSNGWVKVTTGDNGPDSTSGSQGELLSVGVFRGIFAGSSQTTNQVSTAVNALAAAANSKCPVKITILGNGTGVLDRSTNDQLDDGNLWYVLADGVNWVATTTAPINIAGDYQLTFKKGITGSLSASADWQNEKVRIVPITTKNVVDWLNAPTVSGLFTVCEIKAADDGRRVQIASKTPGAAGGVQVQGGLSNSVLASIIGTPTDAGSKSVSTVKNSDATGLLAGAWARVQNNVSLPIFNIFTGLALQSWAADGQLRFTVPFYSPSFGPTQMKLQFERQGRFIAISDMGMNGDLGLSPTPGGWLRISPAGSPTVDMPQVSSANQGVFRILRIDPSELGSSGTIWIENDSAIEERSECKLTVFTGDTPMPGDKLVVSSPAWGADNQGIWTITNVGETTAGSGDSFAQGDRFTVDTTDRTPVPQSLTPALSGDDGRLIYPVEGNPAVFMMKIDAIYPNQTDGSFTDVRWDLAINYSSIAASAGSVATVADKLGFPTDFTAGVDGYNYDTGLIGEANKIVYGDRSDTATYPGIGAEGSRINISGPLVKRIRLSLLLRVRSSGVTNSDVGDRVRSAIATVVNQSDIGQAIALSAIVTAASKVVGVVSATILSPAYNATNDLIPVQPNEKALVLDLDQDIQTTYVGD